MHYVSVERLTNAVGMVPKSTGSRTISSANLSTPSKTYFIMACLRRNAPGRPSFVLLDNP